MLIQPTLEKMRAMKLSALAEAFETQVRSSQYAERILALIANQLHALGFRNMGVYSLKPKHVRRLVEVWKNGHDALGWKPVSIGTLKNRLAQLRWWAGKANKAGVVAKSNASYGIGSGTLRGSLIPADKNYDQQRCDTSWPHA